MPAVRVSDRTYQALRQLAGEDSMQSVLDEAVENLRRKRLLEQANKGYAALREDPAAWAEELAERAAWDATLADGLKDE